MTGILTVLGCGGSSGVPKVGNDWGKCDPAEPRNNRTRPSIAVQNNDDTIIVDTGPDFREQLNRERISDVTAVFYTHLHSDHVNGMDDLRAIRDRYKRLIPIYGTEDTLSLLQLRFGYMFEQVSDLYPAVVKPHTITSVDLCRTRRIGTTDYTLFLQDHMNITSLGFRFGDVGYSTDMANLEDDAIAVLRGVKIWIADGTNLYLDTPGPHANLPRLLELNEKIGAETIYLTHMKNNLDYQTLCRELPAGFKPGFDGLKIQLDGTVLNDAR